MAVKEIQKKPDEALAKKNKTSASIPMIREILTWYKIDLYDPAQVSKRLDEYFALMEKHKSRPLVSAMAVALGTDRRKMVEMINGASNGLSSLPTECKDLITMAYRLLETAWEYGFTNGDMNPVTGIFIGKNNFGYKDQQDFVIAPKTQLETQSPEEIERKYIESVVVD